MADALSNLLKEGPIPPSLVVGQLRAFAVSLRSPARFDFSVDPPFYPPFEFAEPGHRFTQAFAEAGRAVLGSPVPFGYTAGVSDANLIGGEAGIPCIVYGARAGNWHQCNEWVDVTSLVPCAEVVLATALNFLRA